MDGDDGAYSNPIELMKGLKQKKIATLERQKLGKAAGTPPMPFFSPQHHTLRHGSGRDNVDGKKALSLEDIIRNEEGLESDYASVQDAVRTPLSPDVRASVVPLPLSRSEQRGKSPSMSPPPIPRREDHLRASTSSNVSINGLEREVEKIEEEEDPNAMYATVQNTADKKSAVVAAAAKNKGCGHGHLDTQDSRGYDHLLPLDHSDDGLDSDTPIEAYATVDTQGHGINPPMEAYATVDDRGHGINPSIEAYAVVDRRGHGINPPIEAYASVNDRGSGNAEQMYATVDNSKPRWSKVHPPKVTTPPQIPPRNGGSVDPGVLPRGQSASPRLVARTPPPTSKSPLLILQRTGMWEEQQANGSHLYSTVQNPKKTGHKRRASADNTLNNQVQYRGSKPQTNVHHPQQVQANSYMYSTVQKTSQQKRTPREKPHPQQQRGVTPDEGMTHIYSLPDRKSKKPPPIAPKPRGRQTPSPLGHGESGIEG